MKFGYLIFSPQHVLLVPLLLLLAAESAPHALPYSPPVPMALLCVTAAGTPVELQLRIPATVSPAPHSSSVSLVERDINVCWNKNVIYPLKHHTKICTIFI